MLSKEIASPRAREMAQLLGAHVFAVDLGSVPTTPI